MNHRCLAGNSCQKCAIAKQKLFTFGFFLYCIAAPSSENQHPEAWSASIYGHLSEGYLIINFHLIEKGWSVVSWLWCIRFGLEKVWEVYLKITTSLLYQRSKPKELPPRNVTVFIFSVNSSFPNVNLSCNPSCSQCLQLPTSYILCKHTINTTNKHT